jgi:GxxExxY protein
VGEYFADLVVEGEFILELKSVKKLTDTHRAQLLNYLHISGCKYGYLLNFQGPQLEWQRMVI